MMDTKRSYMRMYGCENAEDLDTVKRCRLALRTARVASRRRDRRHRSRLAVIALPILLNACALPVSFTIATLAADGISYTTSGKSVTDHALSAVANEDCAMWRVLQDRPICRQADVPETMVAAAPAAEESEVLAMVLGAAPAAGGPVAPETAKAEMPAATAMPGEFEATAAAFAAIPAAGESMAPETATTETPVVTALAANGTTAMAAIKPEPIPATTAAPADRETAAEPVQLAILVPPLPTMEAKPKIGRFFVLGSFLKEARALDAMKRGHDFAPRVVRVRIHGKLFHRVVSGPYVRSSIATIRRTLIAEGFPDAWIARLCQNTLRRAPCPTTLAPLDIVSGPPAS